MPAFDRGGRGCSPTQLPAIELDDIKATVSPLISSSSSRGRRVNLTPNTSTAAEFEPEEEPLLSSQNSPRTISPSTTQSGHRSPPGLLPSFPSQSWARENTSLSKQKITAAMEKVKQTKVVRLIDKLAVSSEPGLTNSQLMLTNHDLKPGERAYALDVFVHPRLIESDS